MREPTRPLFAGSRSREVDGLRYWRLASTGRRTAGHDVDGAPDRDHTDTVARVREVGETRPASGLGVEYLDLAVGPTRLLSTDEHQSVADSRRADAAARGRRVGRFLPSIAARVVALERREVRRERELATSDRADAPGHIRRGKVIAR